MNVSCNFLSCRKKKLEFEDRKRANYGLTKVRIVNPLGSINALKFQGFRHDFRDFVPTVELQKILGFILC